MQFELVAKGFQLGGVMAMGLQKPIHLLARPLKGFAHYEKKGHIVLEKRPRIGDYTAKIGFHLPKHTITALANGYTPEQALHEAALEARRRAIKFKEKGRPT